MRKAPGDSDDVVTDLIYTVMYFIAMYYVNHCQGSTILLQLYLYMFTFEYACNLASIYTALEVAVTADTCSEVKCVF